MHSLTVIALTLLSLLSMTSKARSQFEPDAINADPSLAKCDRPRTDFPGFNLTLTAEQDLESVGPYDIINCAHHTSTARYALSTTQRFASLAAADSLLGPSSEFGFAAFFKSINAVPRVHEILTNIADGTVPYQGGCFPGARPAVLCINANAVITREMRAICSGNNLIRAYTNVAFPHVVMLCPNVWDLPDIRERNVKCPTLDKQGKLTPNDDVLVSNPQSLLVHEFAHIYYGVANNFAEKYRVQDAIDLSEQDSLWNAVSYSMYVAAVIKRCRTWPQV